LRLVGHRGSYFTSLGFWGWKPGLASKRIATDPFHFHFSSSPRELLETRTRFKEDCDNGCHVHRDNLAVPQVGNQDSLQRGLRHPEFLRPPPHFLGF